MFTTLPSLSDMFIQMGEKLFFRRHWYSLKYTGVSDGLNILKKKSVNFSSSSFVIRVNLVHPLPSLFLYG